MLDLLTAQTAGAETDVLPAEAQVIDFQTQVRPIFVEYCTGCHGPSEQQGGLRLDHRKPALQGGDSGEVIVPHESGKSELIRRIQSKDESERMPPVDGGNALSQEEVSLLKTWVEQGALWPEESDSVKVTSTHWAYQPRKHLPPPAVKRRAWVRNPIDQFVLSQLETDSLSPSPEADRYTLMKRLSYDLIGLPPTPEEVDQFVFDSAPDAYDKVVDRLLNSPHFGERWGRHWLDKARYADSDGYEIDSPRPDAYQFRDWVIAAINNDLPFDQFTVEQLAGDLLPCATPAQRIATAFHRQTLTNSEGGVDQEEYRVLAVIDRTNTTAAVWLGLTAGCAQCHSYKYDQITQAEYYQLFAFFNNADEINLERSLGAEAEKRYELQLIQHEEALATLKTQLEELQQRQQTETGLDETKELKKLRGEIEQLRKKAPQKPLEKIRVLGERLDSPRTTHLLRRGDFLQPAQPVHPGTLAVLHALALRDPSRSADRLDLARWITSPENPLTPRVAVNQIWGHLFGRGIVRTMNDFGTQGERPTHPELLDWLADEFLRRGWSRKDLIRTIVASSTYRQSSAHRPELEQVDPTNQLLGRQNRFRVEGEIVRDLHLAASGLLSLKIGGPSVFPAMPDDLAALSYANSFKWSKSHGEDRQRRGMYTFFKRTVPFPDLMTFDCPDSNVTTIERRTSNTPLMALNTLNNEVSMEASLGMVRRVWASNVETDTDRLTLAFRLCVTRPPFSHELQALESLLNDCRSWYRDHPAEAAKLVQGNSLDGVDETELSAWTATARIVMNLDEFITRE
ncbi:DUF1553 domain-containing protein [Planctomicrobium sp. SH661]|uniref:DUF1553 domain-containing protein n=1 Tax=Planctomicrobium sp. SH661 TaxID=3448124 RepID=UPI003F5C6135